MLASGSRDREKISIALPIQSFDPLQKTRNKGISIAVAIRSLDCYYKSNNLSPMCKILNCNDYR